MTCTVGVLEGKELLLYSFPPPHPFTSARVQRFWDELRKKDLAVNRVSPQKADRNLVELFRLRLDPAYDAEGRDVRVHDGSEEGCERHEPLHGPE